MEALGSHATSNEEFVLGAGDLYVEAMVGSEAFLLTLRFFGMSHDRPAEITEALGRSYQRSSLQIEERLAESLAVAGRGMRAGLAMADLVMALTAMMEGYGLRASVQPERVLAKLAVGGGRHYGFSVAFQGIIDNFTELLATDDV
ncbi:MAG: hypothetical protein WBM50_07155 [Acidimicrobiales bacterium]